AAAVRREGARDLDVLQFRIVTERDFDLRARLPLADGHLAGVLLAAECGLDRVERRRLPLGVLPADSRQRPVELQAHDLQSLEVLRAESDETHQRPPFRSKGSSSAGAGFFFSTGFGPGF